MTLRARISIVPFGDEDREEELHQINISNLEKIAGDLCLYGVEVDKYKTREYDFLVEHYRSMGALELVRLALEKATSLGNQYD